MAGVGQLHVFLARVVQATRRCVSRRRWQGGFSRLGCVWRRGPLAGGDRRRHQARGPGTGARAQGAVTGRGEKAMTLYFLVKYLHVLGAIVILGTGTGIAFFMLMAHRSGDVGFLAQTARVVVLADMIFTASAV